MAPSPVSWNKHLGMVGRGEGGATHVYTNVHTHFRGRKKPGGLCAGLCPVMEEEEEPAESGGC